ncbi:MAG: CoB--CoM heterodisulfide reductase iron-sulfur subunit A family protein [Candidatus Thermoplasmatota archaeon]|jgi:heterodisulfide reductase subunit A|nr:CoB--CoM heterodisulfide reductase iron-sulfur subunit A family protein [Candidatus Thermoplasmatota archaeon]
MRRIGVFVCHCGINIAQNVDVKTLTEYASHLNGVVVAKEYKYMCSDVGATLIKDTIKEFKLDGIVIASCSPRMHEHTFRRVANDGGVNPYRVEISNIREQCSWAHSDKQKATEKAKYLVRSAVSKALSLEPLKPSTLKVIPEALIIGGGIAGIQASLDLANDGFKVHLVERDPSIGGHMAQLDKTFPTLDCSSCILTPKMMEVANHENIELLSYAEIVSIEGSIGNYTVKIRKKPRYVDVDKCTGCGDCATNCRLKDRITSEFNQGMGKRGAAYMPFPQAVPLKYVIDDKKCLFLTKGKCGDEPLCKKACAQNAICFDQKEEIIERKVGAIIVATGYDVMDPAVVYEYGYDQSPDVITTLELERLISSSGPTKGEILRPSNQQKPKSVTFILCVGSRDETQCSWCCRIGCMTALKQVYLLREKLGEDVEINVCYNDLRSFGKGYEEFYRKVRGLHTNMFRGRPSEVRPMTDHLKIDIFDTTTNKLFEIKTDMVVLVPAMMPRKDAAEFARLLHLTLSGDGFFLEAHPKLRPVDTFVNGIFIAGCCQAPKDIQDTVSQASAAASRATTILSQEELEIDPLIAMVDEDVCTGCGICIEVCPYEARTLNERKRIAEVNNALCAGCGSCIAACPSNASIHKNFTKKQLLNMVDDIM